MDYRFLCLLKFESNLAILKNMHVGYFLKKIFRESMHTMADGFIMRQTDRHAHINTDRQWEKAVKYERLPHKSKPIGNIHWKHPLETPIGGAFKSSPVLPPHWYVLPSIPLRSRLSRCQILKNQRNMMM